MGWKQTFQKKMKAAGMENDIPAASRTNRNTDSGGWQDKFRSKMEAAGMGGDIIRTGGRTAADVAPSTYKPDTSMLVTPSVPAGNTTSAAGKYNVGQGLAKAGQMGLTQIAKVGSSAGAWIENLLGDFAREGSNGYWDPDTSNWLFNRWNRAIDAEAQGVQQRYAENTARGGKAAQVFEDLGAATVAAVPQAIAALFTGGASAAAQAGALAENAAASSGLVSTISRSMRAMAKDPNFQLSFAQVFGPGYEQAKADGADDFRASVYAIGNGLMNAAVEVGGGIQTLPRELQNGGSAWKAWVDTMLDEGKEEVVQGVIERATQNAVYGRDNPLVGIGNGAIFDPAAAAEEFAGGAVVGGILGGGQVGVNTLANRSAYNAARAQYDRDVRQNTAPEMDGRTAEAVEAVTRGETITGNQAAAIARDPVAVETLEASTGVKLDTEKPISQLKREIIALASRETAQEQTQRAPAIPQTQKRAQKAVGGFMEAGQRAYQQMRETSGSGAEVYAGFSAMYNAGLNGVEAEKAKGKYAAMLTPEQRYTAYNAGLEDARAQVARENADAATVTTTAGAGLADNAYSRYIIAKDKGAASTLNTIGKKLGVRIEFVDSIMDGQANGQYIREKNLIQIAADSTNPIYEVAGHEVTHRMQDLSPDEYRAFRQAAIEYRMRENGADTETEVVQRYMEVAERAGVTLTQDEVMDEIAADFAGRMIEDTDLFAQFAKDNRTAAQKLLDELKEFIAKVKAMFTGKARDNAAMDAYGKTFGELEDIAQKWQAAFDAAERQAERATVSATVRSGDTVQYDDAVYSLRVTDKDTLDFLDKQKTITTYKTMQLVDGKLYPPMAARVDGKYEDASELGAWEMSVERPDLVKDGKFKLDKGKGQGSLTASYNPYMHSSNLVINDQFSGAYTRDNLVTVECEVPVSEMTSGYHADGAKDGVGWHSWHTGTVAGQVRKATGVERKVFLSRWIKPVRILPDAEVANMYKELLGDTGIEVPDNVVTPGLLAELKKAGVPIKESGRVKTAAGEGDGARYMIRNVGGKTMTVIDTENDTRDFKAAEAYLKTLVDADHPFSTILADAQPVYVGKDLPGEYKSSEYTKTVKPALRKIKMQAATNLDEMLLLAENGEWRENVKPKHSKDAQNGWYRYDTQFAVPILNAKKTIDHYTVYGGTLLIRNDADGKSYLYDLLDVEKKKVISKTSFSAETHSEVTSPKPSGTSILTDGENVKPKFSLKAYSEAEKKDHVKSAKEFFGKTYSWNETGYITTDGTKLDFSGRHDGGPGGYRTVDHRDIRDALGLDYGGEDYSGAMVQFMGEGNIRISPESGGINLSVMPTKAQLDTLADFISKNRGEVILDLDDTNGNTVSSTEYPKGTHSSKVINDIRAYFENGTVPKVSELSQFRYQLRSTADIEQEVRDLKRERTVLASRNRALEQRVQELKGEMRKSKEPSVVLRDVKNLGRETIRKYGSDVKYGDIQADMEALGKAVMKRDVSMADLMPYARNAATAIVDNTTELTEHGAELLEIKDYLKRQKILFNGEMDHYNEFRKRYMGTLKLNKSEGLPVDTMYEEMTEMFGEGYFPSDVYTEADKLQQIADVLDSMDSIYENPFDSYRDAAIQEIANDIIDGMISDQVRQKKTFADRRELEKQEAVGRVREMLTKEREKRRDMVKRMRREYSEKTQKGREKRYAAEMRAKIARHTGPLSEKLLRPTDKKHIPDELRVVVADLLRNINLESAYSYDENGRLRKNAGGDPTRRTQEVVKLKKAYEDIIAREGNMVVDPDLLDSGGLLDSLAALGGKRIADMNVTELETVWNAVRAIEATLTSYDRTLANQKYARTSEWADSLMMGSMSRKRRNRKISLDMADPYTFFSAYGDGGMQVYRTLRNAQDREHVMLTELRDAAKKFLDADVYKNRFERHTFTTSRGVELTLTNEQIMNLYNLAKRGEQAMNHLMVGGIVQPEIKRDGKLKAIPRGTENILLTLEDVKAITSVLTPEQIKVADGLQKLASTKLAEWGNEASMAVYGYRKFMETHYWPIKTAKEATASSVEKGPDIAREIKNMGSAKALTPNASNALDIGGVYDVFAQNASDMIKYATLLAPMEDINRLYNYRYRDSMGNLTGKNVRQVLSGVYGDAAQSYWRNLMRDVQNGMVKNASATTRAVERIVGNTKGAAVGANLRVVIQQPTAYFRAAVVLDPENMTKGLGNGVTKGNGWDKARKWAPIAGIKDTSGFDQGSRYTIAREVYGTDGSFMSWLSDKSMSLAGKADAVTWGKIWNACEWQVAADTSLEVGSDAYYQQVAEVFTDVIDQTQVVDGIMQRTQIMRDSDALTRQATSFMGEPLKSLNILMRSYDAWVYETNPQKRSKALKQLKRAVGALLVTDVVNALAQSIVDGLRDDDKDKKYWERVLEAFTGITGEEKDFGECGETGYLRNAG